MARLSYQIPNFTYPGHTSPGSAPGDIFATVVAQAVEAEAAGFDRIMVMDHFYQLPGIGEPDEPMLECYTTLAALAQHTTTVRLSALVTGNTYRNPALLAKTITALDHVSGGRATLGIGAGWFELEHDSLGFEFGTFSDRFEKLEESLQIIVGMLRGEKPTVTELIDYEEFCGVVSDEAERAAAGSTVTPAELAGMGTAGIDFELIDVREPVEWDIVHLDGAKLVPKGAFESGEGLAQVSADKKLVLYCKTGIRSAEVLATVKGAGYRDAVHLQGGINAYARTVDPSLPVY